MKSLIWFLKECLLFLAIVGAIELFISLSQRALYSPRPF
jgi:hypothetical protein